MIVRSFQNQAIYFFISLTIEKKFHRYGYILAIFVIYLLQISSGEIRAAIVDGISTGLPSDIQNLKSVQLSCKADMFGCPYCNHVCVNRADLLVHTHNPALSHGVTANTKAYPKRFNASSLFATIYPILHSFLLSVRLYFKLKIML